MFEPFIEDGVPFDEYCQTMGNDGTWAGHMELQAASLVTHSNICIHRVSSNVGDNLCLPLVLRLIFTYVHTDYWFNYSYLLERNIGHTVVEDSTLYHIFSCNFFLFKHHLLLCIQIFVQTQMHKDTSSSKMLDCRLFSYRAFGNLHVN